MKYSDDEIKRNKVLKMNQELSLSLLHNENDKAKRNIVDNNISSSEQLLLSLGYGEQLTKAKKQSEEKTKTKKHREWDIRSYDELVENAEQIYVEDIGIEDILSQEEIGYCVDKREEINKQFCRETSIINKLDLQFLGIAVALQVTKSLLFPVVVSKVGYGNSIDKANRVAHDDKGIKSKIREKQDEFVGNKSKTNVKEKWVNIIYQGVPYDAIKCAPNVKVGLSGNNHRLHTLGHDPVLGWIFGTLNILTDTITLNDYTTHRVSRKPTMITAQKVGVIETFMEGFEVTKEHKMNLPAAVFAQGLHLASDRPTKKGLPVPMLSTFNESLATTLYKNEYDVLCFGRDVAVIGSSFVISRMFDMIIGLVHGLYRGEENSSLYECRTRKILLISNMMATSSTVIASSITKNPKNLDIGSLLNTISRLFTDITFITRIKQEFIESQILEELKKELAEIDNIMDSL